MSKDLLDLSKEDLQKQLLVENDPQRVKEILDIFNLHLKKKEAIRTFQLSDLQDKVYNQMESRLEQKADNFSNSDLISYFKTIGDSLQKADANLDTINVPQIQVNQQINIDSSTNLDRESRQRVLDAVRSIVARTQESVESAEEITYNNINNEEGEC